MSYNNVRINVKKVNIMKHLNNKKKKDKFIFLPMINPNNGLPNFNFNNYNRISKGINIINNNEYNIFNNGNNINKKNYYKNKITEKNRNIFGFISPRKEINKNPFKVK